MVWLEAKEEKICVCGGRKWGGSSSAFQFLFYSISYFFQKQKIAVKKERNYKKNKEIAKKK